MHAGTNDAFEYSSTFIANPPPTPSPMVLRHTFLFQQGVLALPESEPRTAALKETIFEVFDITALLAHPPSLPPSLPRSECPV